MNIPPQKFRGSDLQEALQLIHQQWGPDALILHVEKLSEPRPLFGQGKKWVEVTAKLPEPTLPTPHQSQESSSQSQAALLEELNSLRGQIQEFGTTLRQMERINWARSRVEKPLQHPLLNFLNEKGLHSENAFELLADWSVKYPDLDIASCMTDLDRRLPRLAWKDLFPSDQGRCTLLLGLPGAGKTSLLIKIAARLGLGQKNKVLLISADMSRAGPSQELALYSEILKIPLKQIFDLSEIQEIAKEVDDTTHILIDWQGVSPYQHESWKPLEKIREYHPHAQTILTASLTSDLRNWESFRHQFLTLPMMGIALTQADLEHRLGKIWEAVHGINLPLALISTGKNIPRDLFDGSSFPFAQYLFQSYSPQATS